MNDKEQAVADIKQLAMQIYAHRVKYCDPFATQEKQLYARTSVVDATIFVENWIKRLGNIEKEIKDNE